LARLRDQGLAYACFCTRADIAQSLTAPHGDAGSLYPGTCRPLPDDPDRRATTPHCWRLDSAAALQRTGLPGWIEADGTRFDSKPGDFGDAILARKDAPSSYHLACVVDDADSGVNLVVRGEDLRPSTPTQRLLQMLLGLPEPAYFHHQLVAHEDGRRLAKRDLAPTLAAMRAKGVDGPSLVTQLLEGQLPLGFRLSGA
jgi:glutamyl-Q tRNA(Asp) synthetase